jgi:peptide/nickel transport system ATP-binding protein
MIFQEPMTSLNPVFRCGHQVAEAILVHQKISTKEAKHKTLALFEKVKLPNPERIFKAYPHELSGGQKQRVMIAMAMSCSPALLIADEPTTALDVTVQKTILELMKDLQRQNDMALLFITHDLGVVREIADKIVVMFRGNIVEQGTVAEVFANPQHPYTRSLLACRPPLDRRLRRLPTVQDFMHIETLPNGKINMIEQPQTVSAALAAVSIAPEEVQRRNEKLVQQPPILEVRNLETWFVTQKTWWGKPTDFVKAVNNVSFSVYPSETLGLVGESGCGKTTLGRTILRLAPRREGQILFEGKDVFLMNEKELLAFRRKVQLIFQDPYSSLNPRLTIGAAIVEPMQVHQLFGTYKQCYEQAIELLETVGLSSTHFNRYPHEFSGGQRQRIGIARALAVNPSFLVCDESVSALDVSVQAQVLNLLVALRQKMNLTMIFISHDFSVVKFISDRILVMNKGQIEEMGFADSVCDNPQTDYTRRLIAAVPRY